MHHYVAEGVNICGITLFLIGFLFHYLHCLAVRRLYNLADILGCWAIALPTTEQIAMCLQDGWNSPIVFAVLALDSCNYCSVEQDPTAQHICKIGKLQTNVHNKRVLSPCVNSLATRWHITGNPKTSYSMKPLHTNIEDSGLSGFAVQSSVSNSLVLIPHRQLGKCVFGPGGTMAWQPNISARIYIGQCFTLTNKLTTN